MSFIRLRKIYFIPTLLNVFFFINVILNFIKCFFSIKINIHIFLSLLLIWWIILIGLQMLSDLVLRGKCHCQNALSIWSLSFYPCIQRQTFVEFLCLCSWGSDLYHFFLSCNVLSGFGIWIDAGLVKSVGRCFCFFSSEGLCIVSFLNISQNLSSMTLDPGDYLATLSLSLCM